MSITRRDLLKLAGCLAASSIGTTVLADASPTAVRLPLEEFVSDKELLAALRRGVKAMKKRKNSDPLSWFYQAAIHGVTQDAVDKAAQDDPKVSNVFRKRYWNQCPHDGENSANFLPWHRGYTYHFEKILRKHTELDRFALPYWNYTDLKKPENRFFPREFGIEHLDGNLENNDDDNKNPLFHPERDYYFCGYEHPFAMGLPLLSLTESAVDISLPMSATVFFGKTEREGLAGGVADENPSTRGLLESYPHDQIHRAVGGVIGDKAGAMATPPTAGFDPIFPIHHSNIDYLWAKWSCMSGKDWGELPSAYWFNERPWFFYDTDGSVVNLPRKAYFDHRSMGIQFKGEDLACKPLALPDVGSNKLVARVRKVEAVSDQHPMRLSAVPSLRSASTKLPAEAITKLREHIAPVRAALTDNQRHDRLVLLLSNVKLGLVQGTGFDVHVSSDSTREHTRSSPSFVGSISMFRHSHGPHVDNSHTTGDMEHGSAAEAENELFDVSKAIAGLTDEHLNQLKLVVVPYSLLSVPGQATTILNQGQSLEIDGMQFLRVTMSQ